MKERSSAVGRRGDGGRSGAFGGGKVILLGEHAVVYGVPALAAGIARGVRAEASPASAPILEIAPWGERVLPTDESDLGRAFAGVLEAHPKAPLPSLAVRAEVELPAGAGLGCSAALGVAVLRALDHAVGHAATDAEIAARALDWERVFHGNPSGVDNAMAAHGGLAIYRRGEPLEPLPLRGPLTLVIGDSGEAASTKAMVAEVARQREREPARFERTLEAIDILVRNARLALADGDLKALGQLMDLNHTLLSSLMLATTALEEMCGAARAAGAHGAKLTGKGGGGCMIALVDPSRAAEVAAAIEATGHRAFVTEVGA